MNIEYIYFITNDTHAFQYFIFNSHESSILAIGDRFLYHYIYGPAISYTGYKSWRINDQYSRKYYPYSIIFHDLDNSTKYEVLDYYTGSIFVLMVKNNVVCNLVSYGNFPFSYQFKIEFDGNSTYTCGNLKIINGYSTNTFVLNKRSPEIHESKLLQRVHEEQSHIFHSESI